MPLISVVTLLSYVTGSLPVLGYVSRLNGLNYQNISPYEITKLKSKNSNYTMPGARESRQSGDAGTVYKQM